MEDTKWMSLKEFQEKGYQQEVNRLFFHPLGLDMVVITNYYGEEESIGIKDNREGE